MKTYVVGTHLKGLSQGSGKLNLFQSQTKIQKLGPIGNSQKPKKIGPILAQY